MKEAWHVVDPVHPYVDNWHMGAIAEHLQAVTRGQIRNFLCEIPPGFSKSLSISVLWPAWIWTQNIGNGPGTQSIFFSYSDEISIRDSVRCRDLIKSDWYKSTFQPDWEISTVQDIKSWFENTRKGSRIASSVGGVSTGLRSEILGFDDVLKANDQYSDVKREEVVSWFKTSIPSRIDPRCGVMVIIMQRLHAGDLAGYVKEHGGFTELCLPNEFDPSTKCITYVNGKKFFEDPRTEFGELLFPQLYSKEFIENQIKPQMTSTQYQGQYQQSPSAEGGGIFKRHWWRYWYPEEQTNVGPVPIRMPDGTTQNMSPFPLPNEFEEVVQSWDLSFKDLNTSDFACGQVWGRKGANKYLLNMINKRMNFPRTLQAIRDMTEWCGENGYPTYCAKYVEDKANGPAVIQTLKDEIDGLIAVNPEGGKVARANAVAPQVESGNVYLPHPSLFGWVGELTDQCADLPNGTHDDMCFIAGTKVATLFGDVPIEDIRPGDLVIVPGGISRVSRSFCSGLSDVVDNVGLIGTPDHSVFTYSGFVQLDALTQSLVLDRISLGGLLRWKCRKLLYSMGLNIGSWGREDITLASQLPMRGEKMLRACMSLFGSFITRKEFPKATLFTIRMVTSLITTPAIWSVYQLRSTANFIVGTVLNFRENTLRKLGQRPQNGIDQKRVGSGTGSMGKMDGLIGHITNYAVSLAEKILNPSYQTPSTALIPAVTMGDVMLDGTTGLSNVLSAGKCSILLCQSTQTKLPRHAVVDAGEDLQPQSDMEDQKVYNLTTDAGVYYANGILVSNCDSLSQGLLKLGKNSTFGMLDFVKEGKEMDKISGSRMTKPVTSPKSVKCPKCGSTSVTKPFGRLHCNACSNDDFEGNSPLEIPHFNRNNLLKMATSR